MANELPGDTKFQALLADFHDYSLDNQDGAIYGMWPDFSLAYFNGGWFRFAAENCGEPQISTEWNLGRNMMPAIALPLRYFFSENYLRSLRESRPWEHVYECSTPERYRLFHMTAYPLGNAEGLLVVNSMCMDVEHARVPFPPLDVLYRNQHGLITQCCHCRRVRRIASGQVWDWVPAWVANHAQHVSHGLCPPCLAYHYAKEQLEGHETIEAFKTYAQVLEAPATYEPVATGALEAACTRLRFTR